MLEVGFLEETDICIEEFFEDGEKVAESISKFVAANHPLMDIIDALSPSSHLTLKVIATIKSNADVELVNKVYPHATHVEAIEKDVEELIKTGLFVIEYEDYKTIINFSCEMTRDIIYALIPQEQRRRLHKNLGKALKTCPKIKCSTLAYHWTKSVLGVEVVEWKRTMRALNMWEIAMEQDLTSDNEREAMNSLQNIIDLQSSLEDFYSKTKSPIEISKESTTTSIVQLSNLSTKQRLFALRSRTSSCSTNNEAGITYSMESIPYISPLNLAVTRRTMSDLVSKKFELMSSTGWSKKDSHCILIVKDHLLKALYYLGLPSMGDMKYMPIKKQQYKTYAKEVNRFIKFILGKLAKTSETTLPVRQRPSMSQFTRSYHHTMNNTRLRMMTYVETIEAINCLSKLADYSIRCDDEEVIDYCKNLSSFFSGDHSIDFAVGNVRKKLEQTTK